MFTEAERRYLDGASLGRLATADADGRPYVILVCFALQEGTVVEPRLGPGAWHGEPRHTG